MICLPDTLPSFLLMHFNPHLISNRFKDGRENLRQKFPQASWKPASRKRKENWMSVSSEEKLQCEFICWNRIAQACTQQLTMQPTIQANQPVHTMSLRRACRPHQLWHAQPAMRKHRRWFEMCLGWKSQYMCALPGSEREGSWKQKTTTILFGN